MTLTWSIGLGVAVIAMAHSVRAAAALPEDQMRMLVQLVAFVPPAGTGSAGAVTAALCRRAAAIVLATAAANYQPTSYDDAIDVLRLVTAALDQEILAAGDAGQDRTYLAFRALRAAVVADLVARGANLAPLVTITRAVALPSLVVAQQIYNDATRAGEVVRRVNPVHPAFMPHTMQVLAR